MCSCTQELNVAASSSKAGLIGSAPSARKTVQAASTEGIRHRQQVSKTTAALVSVMAAPTVEQAHYADTFH